jgi:hypothetical protein
MKLIMEGGIYYLEKKTTSNHKFKGLILEIRRFCKIFLRNLDKRYFEMISEIQ